MHPMHREFPSLKQVMKLISTYQKISGKAQSLMNPRQQQSCSFDVLKSMLSSYEHSS